MMRVCVCVLFFVFAGPQKVWSRPEKLARRPAFGDNADHHSMIEFAGEGVMLLRDSPN